MKKYHYLKQHAGRTFLLNTFVAILSGLLAFGSCKKESDKSNNDSDNQQSINISEIKEVNILPTEDYNISITDNIGLFVQNGTFVQNTEISYAVAENIPLLNDSELEITEKPVFLFFPISAAQKGMTLSMPLKQGFDRNKAIFFVSDGEDIFPLFYNMENNTLKIDIDLRSWTKYWNESVTNSSVVKAVRSSTDDGTSLGKFIVFIKANSNKDIPDIMKGLKIPVNPIFGKKFTDALPHKYITQFDGINSIESNENILLFIHGWAGNPESTWWDFLESIENSKNDANTIAGQYSKTVTFGYNSGRHIEFNGKLLADEIKKINKGNKNIDIVAHSMGGLVARVAIEKYGCDKYVRKIITLGTPHKGTPLGAYRNWILSDKEKNVEQTQTYTFPIIGEGTVLPELTLKEQDLDYYILNTEGFEDLDAASSFMLNYINPPTIFSDIKYITIGATSKLGFWEKGFQIITETITPPHDGVVELASALGLKNNSTNNIKEKVFEILWIYPTTPPHVLLTEQSDVLEYVFNALKEELISTDGLVAYYPFNGNANDESGNDNHGTVIGNLNLTAGRKNNINGAYEFSGEIFNYISVPDKASLNINSFTISAWINIPEDGGGYILNKGRDIENGSYRLTTSGVGATTYYGGVNDALFLDRIPYDQWVLLTGTVSGDIAKSYINGQLIDTKTLSDVFSCNSPNEPVTIGTHYYHGVPSVWAYPFKGKIDDVRIYNRVLTETEIQSLYKK